MTPIERIARAICERAGINPDVEITLMEPNQCEAIGPFGYKRSSNFAPAWQFFVPHAMAALEAMREPSAAMLANAMRYGWHMGIEDFEEGCRDAATEVWQDMLALALAEHPNAQP